MLTVGFDAGSPFIEAVHGGILGLKVRVIPRGPTDVVVIGGPPAEQQCSLISSDARLTLNGMEILPVRPNNGLRFGDRPESIFHQQLDWIVPLSRETIVAVEAGRTDDVIVDFSCQLNFWIDPPEHGSHFTSAFPTIQRKLSAKDWLEIRENLGFGGTWTIEIVQPGVGGLDESVKFLQSAWAKLGDHDPVGAMSELRKAWDRADPVVDAHPEWTNEAINGLSTGEPERKTKGERVRDIRSAIDKLVQIGPHSDVYDVTSDDAFLAYRLTVSMLAYLAKKTREGGSRHS